MQLHVTTKHLEPSATLEQAIEHGTERLRRRLRHFSPDLVHLTLALERQARKGDYRGSVRLSVGGRVLPARRNRAATAEGLVKAAFDDLEEQLAKFISKLRRDHAHERRRASLPQDLIQAHERELLEERELLDRALNGDRDAFDRLVGDDLAIVQHEIEQALIANGRDPSPQAVEHVLGDVLAIAFRRLASKPARWTLAGWLTWLARREIRREARGLAVAQSVEARS